MERSAGAIIRNKRGKYLVIKGRQGFWGFPKGHIRKGESPEDAAKREVLEEVGLVIELQPERKCAFKYLQDTGEPKEVTFFFARPKGKAVVKKNDEVKEYKWLSPKEVVNTLSFPDLVDVFKKVIGEKLKRSSKNRIRRTLTHLYCSRLSKR